MHTIKGVILAPPVELKRPLEINSAKLVPEICIIYNISSEVYFLCILYQNRQGFSFPILIHHSLLATLSSSCIVINTAPINNYIGQGRVNYRQSCSH